MEIIEFLQSCFNTELANMTAGQVFVLMALLTSAVFIVLAICKDDGSETDADE